MGDILSVLLVEDNPGDAFLLEEMLRDTGIQFELTSVDRLKAGVEVLNKTNIDVILLDLGLPDSQGISTLVTMNEIGNKAPIIVLTGLADESIGTQAVKSGAQDYLIKGQIDKNMLFRSISYAIERKQAAEAIQAAAREWSASFDAMSDGIAIQSIDHTILNANKSFFQLVKKPAEHVIGKKCYQIVHGLNAPIKNCIHEKSLITNQQAFSECFEPALGIHLAESASPVLEEGGTLTKIVHTFRDITQHKQLESQLLQSQKMESVGTLAGGIAHDFNNILTAIIGYGNLTLMKMNEDNPYRQNIQRILEASDRAAYLTKELLMFSRKQVVNKTVVNLNSIVTKTKDFLQKVIGEDIKFNTELYKSSVQIVADEYQLEQVLMNLATNARDAMPHGGEFSISTNVVTLSQEFTASHKLGDAGEYALIEARDSGSGMDAATQLRIFDPFFTTKDVQKGTGLGLSIVYGIIEKHDGYIKVASEKDKGTTFTIYLPLTKNGRDRRNGDNGELPMAGGSETILLVEDDTSVRQITKTVLVEFGYTVIEAEDGVQAIRKFAESSSLVNLVLMDLIMPNMNGAEALEHIRLIKPGIKTIFFSGHATDTIQQKVSLEKGTHMLSKPVTPIELLREVRTVLNGQE